MERTDFASIVPKVKVWETRLLNKGFYEKLMDLNSLDEAIKSLQETTYGNYISNSNFEESLELSYKDVCEELYKTMKHTDVVKFIRLKNDYNNIKTLVKSKILNKDFSYILNENGTVDLEVLKVSFKNNNFRDLHSIMIECIEESFKSYEKNNDVQKVDIVIDNYMYKHMKAVASCMDSKFMSDYTEMLIDLTNLKTSLRVKKLNKDKVFLKEVLLDGGKLSIDVFLDMINSGIEDIPNKFIRTSYSKLVSDSIAEYLNTNSLSALEKNIDNYVMKFVRDAKFVSLGVEPVFAYLYARETEIKNLRIVLAGKLNNVDSSIIKERLRDNYV